jgi:glycosyltransferase involved in cell wall biosynthesis
MEWVLAAAAAHPETVWAVTGSPLGASGFKDRDVPNVVYTGRLSDGKMKALMENCRALVHPAVDEGFGIPPLEALSVGRPILVSRAACLPEIYGDAAYWIERPMYCDGQLDLRGDWKFKSREAKSVLADNTWEKVSKKLLEAIS